MAVSSTYPRSRTARFPVVLPAALRDTLKRIGHEIAGTLFAALGLFLLLSLASYSPSDPSLNTATGYPPQNWVGLPGALVADLLVQSYGMASVALILPFVVWGASVLWRGAWLAPRRETGLRIAAWPLSAVALATGLAALPVYESWPLVTGLGGLVGDAFFSLVSGLPDLGAVQSGTYMGFLATGAGLAGLLYTLGFRRHRFAAFIDTVSLWAFLLREAVEAMAERLRREPQAYGAGFGSAERQSLIARLLRRDSGAPHERRAPDLETGRGGWGDRLARRRRREEKEAIQRLEEVRVANRIVRNTRKVKPGRRAELEAQPALELEPMHDYQLPPLSLLTKPKPRSAMSEISDDALEQNARMLETVLQDFGVRGDIIRVRPGPVVTLYELEPAAGIKSSRVIALADDIARSMSAVSARVAVVPGRNVIGIELPNSRRDTVLLRELLSSGEYENASSMLALALGKNIGGEPVIADLANMPHLLIAGTTGSGKSVGINTMILSLLYRLSPNQCRLILIDPKMLELSVYEGIPHLLAPVVTDPKKAIVALKWVVREMEDRYRKMSKMGVRNIAGYNARISEALESGEKLVRTVQTGFDRATGQPLYEREELPLEGMHYIVVIVDEMADLMMVAGKEIEGAVQRLAQMARAAGIHLITATQRPSVDVITGTIKANFPTRISFQVTSKVDSRTILGEQGAEQLLGQGDMLYMAGGGRIRRVHGPFVSDEEVEQVVRFLKKQGQPAYLDDVLAEPEGEDGSILALGQFGGEADDLYEEALQIVARDGKASTSYIQRRLQIGYNRAARLIERMEDEGVISAPSHAGKREVLIGERAAR